jgi:endo-alpha-1,4-polygalactosaminidase (GH114 family)
MTKKELEEIHEILTDMVEGLYMDEVDIFECMWRWAKEKYHEQGPKKIGELYNKEL